MIAPGSIIQFDVKKQFKHIKSLGEGGTGDTHLFEDDTTNMLFAFKKYAPKDSNYIEEHYHRFVDEIKILFNLSHPNIVRVYNYYLYPEYKTGYLQMEFIDGISIADFQPNSWGKTWVTIFTETISAFEYLEAKGILHRDIRPANIMIDKNENVKVIDFGFGKKLDNKDQDGKSVLLNWPVTQLPIEITTKGTYNHSTEIYFIGKLFGHIFNENTEDFKFKYIIDKMSQLDPKNRYTSFCEVSIDISRGILSELDFTDRQKVIYREFATNLYTHIYKYIERYEPINDINVTLNKLAVVIRKSSLENSIQNNSQLIDCFINGYYTYSTNTDIKVSTVVDFYELLRSLPSLKQKIVLDNIYTRLAKIKVDVNSDDDLPF
ncbi:protein kinase family protein [Gorillibacterium massiliense]|uniref:protein kinase family protein n=1 Tax=Gorillibacterium massiliense TaxID=1280390 RepID=UPI0004BB0C9E|nr:protein kinase family protein [Gorillibacterium massiliense]